MSASSGATAGSQVGWLRRRFNRWLESRLARNDVQLLTQANIYILPTKAGWLFALTLVVLLLASVNYQLNLGYVLTFLLAGSGIVSLHETHRTLRGLTLHLGPVAPAFAARAAGLDVVLTSDSAARYGIGLRLVDAPLSTIVWTDVPAGGRATPQVTFVPVSRGRHAVPTLSVETRFPLGLFRAWTVWRPAAMLLVYPKVEAPAPPLPAAQPIGGMPTQSRQSDGGEVEGVRAYRRGDPLKLIAWKKAAQALESGSELVSRDTSVSSRRELWLDEATCGGLAMEERLSRLTAWVLLADRNDVEYGLRVGGHDIAPAEGDVQRLRCLEALALG